MVHMCVRSDSEKAIGTSVVTFISFMINVYKYIVMNIQTLTHCRGAVMHY